VPEIVGTAVFAGTATVPPPVPDDTAKAGLVAVATPSGFVATTRTTSFAPASATVGV
jgi:hypothetical protein